MHEPRAALRAELLAFVTAPAPERFDELATRVVAHQAAAIPPYGRLVSARDLDGASWRDAPLVPTELFRELDLCSAPPDAPVPATFLTSGTTGAGARGRRRVPDLTLYHAAMWAPFVAQVLGGDAGRRPWLCLVPPATDLPESSLSHMVGALAAGLADPSRTAWPMTGAGLDVARAERAIARCAADSAPALVLTTAFALVQLLDALPPSTPSLPAGSRMMLTGGFKGRTRELREDDLLATVEARLGIAPGDVVPEYGMTELTSQAYGRPLVAPPWLALRVVDPETQRDLPAGSEGLVACFDLLNLDNVSAILTSDLGVLDATGGLTLVGRAARATPRGCSLTAEDLGA